MSAPLPDLPINAALPALMAALAPGRSVLLQAPPGAGKSTIVPLELLRAPWMGHRKILMLEPRRLAARAVAGRMAQLLGEAVGGRVGYRTRFDTRVGRDTRVEVVTEGILTRMLQDDAALEGVACVIFDEFHERSLNADLGLALCIESRRNLRDDLALLVMSATLDLGPLSRLLDDAPLVHASGRSFEVDTFYVPRRPELHLEQQLVQVVRKALADHPGDVLCFLPGAAEIARAQRILEESPPAGARVMPLYGELSAQAQDAALGPLPGGGRKIVLATTIAETSLTIEGIGIVVDSGLRRLSEFDPATGMSRLLTAKVSQAAADQRRGRAGRVRAGVCLPALVGGHPREPGTAHAAGDPQGGPRAAGVGARLLGRTAMPASCAGSILRRSRRSPRRATCCAGSKPSTATASPPTAAPCRAWVLIRGSRI